MKRSYPISMSIVILVGCSDGGTRNRSAGHMDKVATEQSTLEGRLCFRNIIPHEDDPSKQDMDELILNISGGNVTGFYSWIPAEKDQRKGEVFGTIDGQVATVQYIFVQEGQEDLADLEITIGEGKAVVQGGKPELGLAAIIQKVDCVNHTR